MACLAAGLMLGSASASAQDAATTTNTPAAQAVGPRELENFSLQGNVTRLLRNLRSGLRRHL